MKGATAKLDEEMAADNYSNAEVQVGYIRGLAEAAHVLTINLETLRVTQIGRGPAFQARVEGEDDSPEAA